MKKLLNDPKQAVPQFLEGYLYAYSSYVKGVKGIKGIVTAAPNPKDKVQIVIGGGSGHEPFFWVW